MAKTKKRVAYQHIMAQSSVSFSWDDEYNYTSLVPAPLNTSRFKPPSFVARTLQIKYAFSVIVVKRI